MTSPISIPDGAIHGRANTRWRENRYQLITTQSEKAFITHQNFNGLMKLVIKIIVIQQYILV